MDGHFSARLTNVQSNWDLRTFPGRHFNLCVTFLGQFLSCGVAAHIFLLGETVWLESAGAKGCACSARVFGRLVGVKWQLHESQDPGILHCREMINVTDCQWF